MADGSVIIAAELDTAPFYRQINALETQLAALADRMQASVQAAVASSGVDTAMLLITAAITEAMDTMAVQTAGRSAEAARGAVAGFRSVNWNGTGSNAANAVADGFSNGAERFTSIARSTANQARNAFVGNWYSLGTAISEGIAAGIGASAGAVTAAVTAVAEQAMKTAKAVYEIASPSRRMRDEVGVMLSKGIAEGILDGSRYIEASIAQVGQHTGFTGTAAGNAGGIGNVIQNIYLRDTDTSPYATARAIRKESEAMLRI